MSIRPMSIQAASSSLSNRIEESERLDKVAERLQTLMASLPVQGRLRSLLSGTWLGHPAHPFLVATPIGCWTSAGLLDLSRQRVAARLLIGAGVASVVPTALTGLSDWADTGGAERRVGLVHLATNTVATALYAWSWVARRNHYGFGVALSLAGAGTASAGGWLGGHLAYAMGVGVDTNAFDGSPLDWTAVPGSVSDGSLARTAVGPTALVATRHGGVVRVLADRCSHRGASLAEGSMDAGCVTCPWHGSRFDLTSGQVRQGPAVVAQPVYDAREGADGLEVRRDESRALRANTTHP